MRIASLVVLMALMVTTTGWSQGQGSRSSVRRPNSSNFGWQDRQQEATKALIAELGTMSDEEWTEKALATMSFLSGDNSLQLTEVTRISAAVGDKKATTERGEYYRENSPAWIVRFNKKPPRKLTLTLTDERSTEIDCVVDDMVEHRQGYVGVFFHGGQLMCLTRPISGS